MHKNLFASSRVHDTNLRDALLGKDNAIIPDEEHKVFHNTFELHNLIFEIIKLSGNKQNSELESLNKR